MVSFTFNYLRQYFCVFNPDTFLCPSVLVQNLDGK